MANVTILENKNLIIRVSFENGNIEKYVEVEIEQRQLNIIEKYLPDEDGNAKKDGEAVRLDPAISLTDFALKKKRDFYKDLLKAQYSEIENLVILSGAGSSVGIGKLNKGLTMVGLWNIMHEEKKECLTTLIKETKYSTLDKDNNIIEDGLIKDLEALLSKAGMIKNVSNPFNNNLSNAIDEARQFIAEKCSLDLPDDAPHFHFLTKALLRPQKYPRVKIFTLNYDTLFEQAAGKEKFTVIDGFTFSSPRVFNGKYFDYDIIETRHNRQDKKDSTISKLFYLFKMHGSLSWKNNKINSEIEQFDGKEINIEDRVMIFPQDSKYEHSYEQPYFEMMARFQQALRTENTLLITIGFSFLDKHISSVIIESIKQNPSLNLLAFTFPEVIDTSGSAKPYQKELHKISEIQSRVTLVSETFKDFANEYPENKAHNRFDLLEELNDKLKQANSDGK